MTTEISVVAVMQAAPGKDAALEAVIRPCVMASRLEEGCRAYTAHRDLDVPGRFVFIERWASREALAAHEKEPHFQALIAGVAGKLEGPVSVSVLSALT